MKLNILYLQRMLALGLRPAVIYAEMILIGHEGLLVQLYPAVGLIVMVLSVPTYIDYYKNIKCEISKKKYSEENNLQIFIGVLVSVIYSAIVYKENGTIILFCLVYLIEKYSDEISRFYEFQKKYHHWFGVQIIRNIWAIGGIIFGSILKGKFLLETIALLDLFVLIYIFYLKLNFKPKINYRSSISYAKKINLSFGSILPSISKSFPKIYITSNYPQTSHIFLLITQITSALGVYLNTVISVPYRNLIARKPLIYSKKFKLRINQYRYQAIVFLLISLVVNLMMYIYASEVYLYILILTYAVFDIISYTLTNQLQSVLMWSKNGRAYARISINSSALYVVLFCLACFISSEFFQTLITFLFVNFVVLIYIYKVVFPKDG